ncbi:MAG: SAM-dependent DNA methyltransferase [Selenomonadaceae bacterium]|nr:SAM-dependent DNA methyltransferase [Selenomonadaceae bacterium]
MALGNLIKSWENIMRDDDGVNGTVQVLSQLVWMLFLKVYDLREDMWEFREDDFKSAIPENCRWRNWAKGKSQKEQMTGDTLVDFVDNTLFPTLKKLSVTAESSKRKIIVRDMMAESYNYMKDGVCIRKAVNLLDSIDFENQEELHAFNVIYETLLRGLQSAGRSGEFYTPRAITKFITEKVNPELGKITADFACGTGGFLIDAVEHLRKQIKRAEDNAVIENTVFGIEKKQFPYMLCATNMLLHDVDYPRISHANSLAKNVREYKDSEKVDFVLMNPPYGGHEQEGIQVNFPSKLRSSETANLFMIEILYRLKNNGRCGVVLPDGFLQNDDASLIAIKKKLFDECDVHTIIRLPSSCFAPYTSIATNLLFFDKRGGTKETWFYRFDLPSGQKFSMKKNPITREKLGDIDKWWDNRVEIKDEKEDESLTTTYKAKCVSIDEIAEGNYNLDFCGFPNEEKIILSPEETIEHFKKERDRLDKKLDEKLKVILKLLEVK